MSAQNNSPNPRLPTQTPTSCSLGIFSSSPLSHLLSRRRIVLLCLRVLSVCANYCVSAVSSSHNRSVCLVRCQSLARTHRCHSRHQVKSWISCLLFCDRIRKLVHLDCIAILPFLLSKTSALSSKRSFLSTAINAMVSKSVSSPPTPCPLKLSSLLWLAGSVE